jgi:hypothetical protein
MQNEPLAFPGFPPLPQPALAQPVAGPAEKDVTPTFIAMARTIAAICATRFLLLLAVMFSGVGLVWTIADPQQMRVIASTAYAMVVVWPLVGLYWRKG